MHIIGFIFYVSYINENRVFWLISLSIMPSRSTHIVANGKFRSFSWLSNISVFHCSHLLYPFICQWTCCCCLVAKSYPTLCNPMDCILPGSSVRAVSQTRILEWVSIFFSRGSSQPRDQTCVSYIGGQTLHHWTIREVLDVCRLLLCLGYYLSCCYEHLWCMYLQISIWGFFFFFFFLIYT